MKEVGYLIVGQGIAGTLLSLELLNAGQRIFILNKETDHTSSNKAAGLYNPITGRKMVKTWLADELFESLEDYYKRVERLVGETFIYPKPIYRPFVSIEEQNEWQGKVSLSEFQSFVKRLHSNSVKIAGVIDPFGGVELSNCGSVDVPTLIQSSRKYFLSKGIYKAEMFDYEKLSETGSLIQYGEITAKKIIFCEGPGAVDNPYSKDLPFKLVKGEILDIEAVLPTERILNRGVFMLPRKEVFKVGSTYDHSEVNHTPTELAKTNILERLNKIYSGEYKIKDHRAGVRPATYDRKPLIGMVGKHKRIGIFNGFGAKGVSLTPFFATQFVNYLLGKGNILPEADLHRTDK